MVCLVVLISITCAQERTNVDLSGSTNHDSGQPVIRWRPGLAPTKAYQREVRRLMIQEVNRVARDLKLEENLPLTESNVLGAFVNPPAGFINRSILGTLSTSNYEYYLTAGRTVSGMDERNLDGTWERIKAKYTWPINRLDTNAALQVATQIMATAGMDAGALNRDCKIDIRASMTEGPHGKHFVPDYWVSWQKQGKNTAFLEFLEPTKSIRQLHVMDSKYILSKPVEIPNLEELLKQTNDPPANPFSPG